MYRRTGDFAVCGDGNRVLAFIYDVDTPPVVLPKIPTEAPRLILKAPRRQRVTEQYELW